MRFYRVGQLRHLLINQNKELGIMGVERQAEGTAIFGIAFSFVIGVFLTLFLTVWNAHQSASSELQQPLPQSQAEGVLTQEMTVGEQRRAWFQAMEGLIQESNKVIEQSNAGYKFDACFMVDGNCEFKGTAVRDEFRKTTFYFPMNRFTDYDNHVGFYLSVKDGDLPHLVMRFVYVGKEWIYIDKASILVDGEFVLEESLLDMMMERKAVTGNLVYEFGDLFVTDKVDVIEQIANAETLAVRIEGNSGYVNLNKGMLDAMQVQAGEILSMYRLTTQTIEMATMVTP